MSTEDGVLDAAQDQTGRPLWQADAEWRENKIRSTARGEMWTRWLFAAAFLGFSIPIAFALPDEIQSGNHAAWIALLFPASGLFLLWSALARTRDWLQIGRLSLNLDPFPGSIGGDVGGSVEIPIRYDLSRRFRVALACSRIYETGSGDSRSTSEKVLWDQAGIAETHPTLKGTRVSFRFTPPKDLPESEPKSDDYRQWAIRIQTDEKKPRFDRLFVIPVFKTGSLRSSERIKDSHETLVDVPVPPRPHGGMRMERTPYGVDLTFRAFRNWGIKLVFGIFGIVCLAVASFLSGFLLESMSGGAFAIVMGAISGLMAFVFGLIGLVLVLLFIWEVGNSFGVQISRQQIVVSRRWFGIPVGRSVMPADRLASLDWSVGARAGRGAGSTKYQRLIARDSNGTKITIAEGIRDPALARHIEDTVSTVTKFRGRQ